jgi:hypothetical protein
MAREKMYFIGGLLIGVLMASLFLFYFAPRYATVKSGETLIRQDKWTGQSWRFTDNQWKAIVGQNHDWEKVDSALVKALHIPFADVDAGGAMKLLREKHPILKTLSDEELLERIKTVYSRQILTNMYLDSFLKVEKSGTQQKQ